MIPIISMTKPEFKKLDAIKIDSLAEEEIIDIKKIYTTVIVSP